mmetsp:Transcript_74975/g.160541  ORF Transcript_74975/g.160541 Transcript_74975/m.160541 type:complete len:836 (-) Transcript_74975:75-2582(-)
MPVTGALRQWPSTVATGFRRLPSQAGTVISADIFPVCTADIPVLWRLRVEEAAPSVGSGGGGLAGARALQRVAAAPAQRVDPASQISSLSAKELRSFVQKRRWSVSTGGDIVLSGKGRTRELIEREVVAKLLEEAQEGGPSARKSEPSLTVEGCDGTLFATSEDLAAWHCAGWQAAVESPGTEVLSKLAAEVLQRQSRLADATRSPRWSRWASYDVPLLPIFSWRGSAIGTDPCVALLVSHVARPPPELNLAEICGGLGDAVTGLEIQVSPSGRRGVIVGFAGRLGEGGLREELLGLTASEEMREAIKSCADYEPCWRVRLGRFRGDKSLTYLGSKLRPLLTMSNMERMDRVMGRQASSQVGRDSILPPGERRRLVDGELERLQRDTPAIAATLFPTPPTRVSSLAGPGGSRFADRFLSFQAPRLSVGDGRKVSSGAGGGALWSALQAHGLYRYEPGLGRGVRMRGYVLGKAPVGRDLVRGKLALEGIASLLRQVHLEVDTGNSLVSPATSVDAALAAAERDQAQAVVFFAATGSDGWYFEAKEKCLRQSAPGLQHLASQWIDLSRPDHKRPALLNVALQLCAKLGHTPYVLDVDERNHRADPLLCGLDVCHLQAQGGGMVHMIAGLQLRCGNGEVEQSWVCQGRIEGESIPASVLRTVVSKEACAGREVVIHRDGRFTNEEKEFLAQHAEEVGALGPFGLVEIVKYAGGTPRMYAGDGNAESGSFLRLSDTECILTSGSCRAQGTRNPLLLRVVGSGSGKAPSLSIEAAAEDIFRLSLVSYGSLYNSPRLPVTTKTADKAAYFHASSDICKRARLPARQREPVLMSQGRQQYWL